MAALDGLRLVAALAVAGYHYTVAWRIDGTSLPQHFLPHVVHVSVYGFLGVELFFLISGFVIGLSSWGRTLGDFFTSRVSRLYPAYWAAVVITTAVALAFPFPAPVATMEDVSVHQALINLTMLQQPLGVPAVDSVYWTLFTELRFYLIMALLVRGGLTYRKMVVVCCVWLTVAVLAPTLASPQINVLVVSDYAPYFIAGIALFLIRRFGATPLLFGILGLSWLVSLQRVDDRLHHINPGFAVPAWPGAVIITLAYAAVLAVALGRTDRISWRWLPVAGALTYPFYLLHQRLGYTVIQAGYRHLDVPVWTLLAGTVALLLALAWLVHRFVERRGTSALKAAMRRGLAALDRAEPVPPAPHVVATRAGSAQTGAAQPAKASPPGQRRPVRPSTRP